MNAPLFWFRNMKVIHFIRSLEQSSGGVAKYMQLLAASTKDLLELVIVAGSSENIIEIPDVKIHFLDLSLNRWLSLRRDFFKIIDTEQPDLVHINGIWDPQNFLFQKVAQKMKFPVIISPHGMLEPYILNRHPLKKKIALFLYQSKAIKSADYLHATALEELDHIRKLGFSAPAEIVPNGVNISEIKQKEDWSKTDSSCFNILFLSRIHPKKGIELLISAIELIEHGNLKISIAGEGDKTYVDYLNQLILKKGLNKKFEFLGGVYGLEKWEVFRDADLFVLPTYSENFGIVIIEALAAKIPVITTTGTPWEEIETHKCGWWIEPKVQDLAIAIQKAVNNSPEEMKEMGERGRKLVETKYNIQSVALKMISMYEGVLNMEKVMENKN